MRRGHAHAGSRAGACGPRTAAVVAASHIVGVQNLRGPQARPGPPGNQGRQWHQTTKRNATAPLVGLGPQRAAVRSRHYALANLVVVGPHVGGGQRIARLELKRTFQVGLQAHEWKLAQKALLAVLAHDGDKVTQRVDAALQVRVGRHGQVRLIVAQQPQRMTKHLRPQNARHVVALVAPLPTGGSPGSACDVHALASIVSRWCKCARAAPTARQRYL